MKQNQITLIIIGFILVALMATNPSSIDHKEAIKKEIFKAIESDNNSNSAQQLGEKIGEAFWDAMINKLLITNNYILFSITKTDILLNPTTGNDDGNKIISIGIFGQIILLKKYDKESNEFVDNTEFSSAETTATTDTAAFATETVVKDLILINNISELKSLFKYRDFNNAFVKKGEDYKISLFYIKEAGEDNSGNMYALKIEQQSEIVFVHIFEDNNNKLNILVEPNSGWTDKSQVQLFKTSNNSILIDYNILTNSQIYIKNKIEISYNEISK